MNCLTTALSLVGTFAQYQVQPLPYTFFQANSSGTVLLYKFDSPTQRYLFWRYQNGGLTPLDITQPKDIVRKLDASGRLFGDSGTYQGLRWDGLMSSAFKYNRRVLGRLADNSEFRCYGVRPNGQFYGTTTYLSSGHAVLVNPDMTYQFLAPHTNGDNSRIIDCNLNGLAVGTTTTYAMDTAYTRACRWNGVARDILTPDIGSGTAAPVNIANDGTVFVTVFRGEFNDTNVDTLIWKNPGDCVPLPKTFGNQNYGARMNNHGEAVGTSRNRGINPVPFYYSDRTMYDFRTISDIGQYGATSITLTAILDDGTIFGSMTGGSLPGPFVARLTQ